MSDQGLKIAIAGADVKTATGDDIVFDSTKSSLSIRERKRITVTVDASTGIATAQYFHRFKYKPQMMCFVTTSNITTNGAQYINVPSTWQDRTILFGGAETLEQFDCYHIDDNTVEISVSTEYFVVHGGGVAGHFGETYIFDLVLFMEEVAEV